MPITMDKKASFPVVLETDRDKPAEVRPTFYFKPITMGQWLSIKNWAKAIGEEKDVDKAMRELCDKIGKYLVKWENMKLAGKVFRFNKKRLIDLITVSEGWELIEKIQKQGITAADLGN